MLHNILLQKIVKIFIFFVFAIKCLNANAVKPLNIYTEPNLSIALTKIARLYSKEFNVITSINFNSPENLIADIDMGEAADIFITANEDIINSLKNKGLIDIYNITIMGSDIINLATSSQNQLIPPKLYDDVILIDALKILNDKKSTVILDNYSTSSGKFSSDLIKKLNLTNLKIFNKFIEDRSPLINSISKKDNHYSLLLNSQVVNKKNIKIIAKSPDFNVQYKILIIAGNNMDIARQFQNFFKKDEVKLILKESGILPSEI